MKKILINLKSIVLVSLICFNITIVSAQTNALWLRYPAISPDGKTIVFSYQGNLYKVDTKGGAATALTVGSSHSTMPVWSHDGQLIAFANNRHGNFDVFVIPSSGGKATRLTYNSANDYPYDFAISSKEVLFGSARQAPAESVRFPSIRLFQNLYSVNVSGGRPLLISAAGVENAHFNSDGSSIVFQDRKGYEDPWRKHHTSSVTRDIWLYNLQTKSYTALTNEEIEYREPVFSSDGQYVYYLNEKDGNLNIYKKGIRLKIADQQLTHFTKNPVRHLSIAKDNTLSFTQNGEVYTLKEGQQAVKLNITIGVDAETATVANLPLNGQISQFELSPDGKQLAYISRGELFVTSVEGDFTKRITNTPGQERMVKWSPDNKSLVYAAERGRDGWGIYRTVITNKEEPYFFNATALREEPLITGKTDNFQPKFSLDGKSIAYIEERNILKVFNLNTKKIVTLLPSGHNHSYADGDWDFAWSPDSKWLLVDDQRNYFGLSNAALIKADGTGEIKHPILSGFGEEGARWQMDGKMISWLSSKYGRKSLATQGSREVDVFGAFLDQEAYDSFNLNKEEFLLAKERREKEKKEKEEQIKNDKKNKLDQAGKKEDEKKEISELSLENVKDRVARLTINSSSISDYVLTKDGSKLFYLAAFEKGYDLWLTEPRTKETKILAKLGGSPSGIEISSDEKSLFVMNRGNIVKVDASSGKITPISSKGELNLNTAAEREYIFNHAWLQVKKKFYDPTIHGIDWNGYRENYARFLPHINNNFDFQELLSELLGELNASHTGGRYAPQYNNPDVTATLGLLYDETYAGKGLMIADVIQGGPVAKANSKIKKGSILYEIDGNIIDDAADWAKFLNRKVGQYVHLTGKTSSGTNFNETVKPISLNEEISLMYKRWVEGRKSYVEKISEGKIGYVHVEGMNDASFREVYDRVMGENRDKEALIVDTRFNGGGWLHDDLNTFLSGKEYLKFAPQGEVLKGGEPMARWNKPSAVVMSEGNYSDAFIFPYVYKQNGLGKLIGMPVPGTGTAVWWETQIDPTLIFGIPMIGTIGKENRPTENLQVEPDIKVPLPYQDFLNGKDPQLETAVKELLKK
ncbi:S41 family peptidase [Olivibacter domesticus]|uniref:Tricorn protease homolog n=1 Tax=Olivibacter domesticus TaxID=407022 RepID=A0A1H7IP29_OLID1|nr:S41 family peptidase [Olivibacter domesticus]SEK64178.1 C-terminal processing protease CtpA/Prc, contains a PDZ domain [Olivibacter domesticus]